MKKKLFFLVVLLVTMVAGAWGAGFTRTLTGNLEVTGYELKAFYDFQTNTPAVLPTEGELRYRDGNVWGLHNFASGPRTAEVQIPVSEGNLLILQEYVDETNEITGFNATINCGTANDELSTSTGYHVFDITSNATTINITVPRYGGVVAALVMKVTGSEEAELPNLDDYDLVKSVKWDGTVDIAASGACNYTAYETGNKIQQALTILTSPENAAGWIAMQAWTNTATGKGWWNRPSYGLYSRNAARSAAVFGDDLTTGWLVVFECTQDPAAVMTLTNKDGVPDGTFTYMKDTKNYYCTINAASNAYVGFCGVSNVGYISKISVYKPKSAVVEDAEITKVELQGNFATTGTEWNAVSLTEQSDNVYTGVLDLTGYTDDKSFKLVVNDGGSESDGYAGWIGTNNVTVDAPEGWVVSTGETDNGNLTLNNSKTGYQTYTVTATWEPNVDYYKGWSIKIEGKDARKYAVSVAEGITNGTVTVDKTEAAEGEEVTVTATPADGYELDAITVTGSTSNQAVTVTEGKFTMIADAVTVSATFKESPTGEVFTLKLDGGATSDPSTFFTVSKTDGNNPSYNAKYVGKYNGVSYAKPLKVEAATQITFTSLAKGTLTVVQSTLANADKTIKLDGTALSMEDAATPSDENNENVRVYTIENLGQGNHVISRGDGESGILYVQLEYTAEHVHDYVEDASQSSQPSCTEPGKTVSVCICGEKEEVEIPAFGHIIGENGICTVCGYDSNQGSSTEFHYEKATSIAVGDVVLFTNVDAKQELKGIEMAGNNSIGAVQGYEGDTPAAVYPLTVVEGSTADAVSYAFKNGNGQYLAWTSGNTLIASDEVNNNSSWTVSFTEGVPTIVNVGDNARKLQYNAGSPRFACYTSAQKPVTLWKKVAGAAPAPAVATPEISGETPFVGSTTVTITCETQDASIYYTTDGTDPTNESTAYSEPFELTASATVKAIAYDAAGSNSDVASKEFVATPTVTTVAALNALEDKTAFAFTGEALVVAKPTAKYVYIEDETGSSLIYDNSGQLTEAAEVGKTLAANWKGKVSVFNGLFEVVPDAALAVKDGEAAIVSHPNAELSEITEANVNKVVTIYGVECGTENNKNFAITKDGVDVGFVGRNTFGLENIPVGKRTKILGAIGVYKKDETTTIQFQPIAFFDYPTFDPENLLPNFTYTWNQSETIVPNVDGSKTFNAKEWGGMAAWLEDADLSAYKYLVFEFAEATPCAVIAQIRYANETEATANLVAAGKTIVVTKLDPKGAAHVTQTVLQAGTECSLTITKAYLTNVDPTLPKLSGETIFTSDDPTAPSFVVTTENSEVLANAKVGDIIHIGAEVANPSTEQYGEWSAQVFVNDGADTQLEKQKAVGNVAFTDAQFVITGDILKYIKANGLKIAGFGYTTRLVTIETTETTGSDKSIWVGSSTGAVEMDVNHFKNANDKTGVKAGDIILVTTDGECWVRAERSVNYSWTPYDNMNPTRTKTGYVFVINEENLEEILTNGFIVNQSGSTITQVELIPKPAPLYVIGDMNNWSRTAMIEMEFNAETQAYEYSFTIDNEFATFAIADYQQTAEEAEADPQWSTFNTEYRWDIGAGDVLASDYVNGDAVQLVKGVDGTVKLPKGTYIVSVDPETMMMTITKPTLQYDAVYAVGNGTEGSAWMNGENWTANAEANKMTKVEGTDHLWEITFKDVTAGEYKAKFAIDGTWDINFGGSFLGYGFETNAEFNSSDIVFTTTAEKQDITLRIDLSNYNPTTNEGATFTVIASVDKNPHVVAGCVGNNGETGAGEADLLFGTTWDGTAEANQLAYDATSKLFTKTYEAVAFEGATDIFYKIVISGWKWVPDGANLTCEIPAAGTYDITVTYNAETGEATMTATPSPEDIVINPEDITGGDITAAIAAKTEGKTVKNLTINLAAGEAYTLSKTITAPNNLVLKGDDKNPATITLAADMTDNVITLDGTKAVAKKSDGTDSDHKLIASVEIIGVKILGLQAALIKDTQKTLLETLTISDAIVEMPAAGKNVLDFNSKGYVGKVIVKNSTIYAKGKNTGFFAQYGSRPKNVNGDWLQEFDVQNSTIVNIANGKNFCDLKQNGTAQNVYTLKNNIFADCGKQNQVVVGFNKGQASATPVWDVDANVFNWGGADVSAAETTSAGKKAEEDIVKNSHAGVITFTDAANGDFNGVFTAEPVKEEPAAEEATSRRADATATLLNCGDPRWTIELKQGQTITIADNIKHGTVVADMAYAGQGTVVTITATPDENYKLERMTVEGEGVDLAIEVTMDDENPNVGTFTMPAGPVIVRAEFKYVIPAGTHILNINDIYAAAQAKTAPCENATVNSGTKYDLNEATIEMDIFTVVSKSNRTYRIDASTDVDYGDYESWSRLEPNGASNSTGGRQMFVDVPEGGGVLYIGAHGNAGRALYVTKAADKTSFVNLTNVAEADVMLTHAFVDGETSPADYNVYKVQLEAGLYCITQKEGIYFTYVKFVEGETYTAPAIDVDALKAEIAAAKKLLGKDDVTVNPGKALNDAITAATDALKAVNAETTQETVDKAVTDLQAAEEAYKLAVAKSELSDEIAKATELLGEASTDVGTPGATLKQAIDDAQAVLDSTESTLEDINKAIEDLQAAEDAYITTGIDGVNASKYADGEWYTTGGVRVDQPTKKGLYIHNGRKVVIK